MKRMPILVTMSVLLVGACTSIGLCAAADSATTSAATTSDPKVIGKRIAENFVPSPPARRGVLIYPEVCTAYGCIRFAAQTKDDALLQKLIARYQNLPTAEGKSRVPAPVSVDTSVFGILPMEIYRHNDDKAFLTLGLHSPDTQWSKLTPEGLTTHTRFWLDDMFMISAVQTEAFRVTQKPEYLDHAAKEMSVYIDRLQLPSGIFNHSTGPGLFAWGRANGWMAAGMSELLEELPADHPERKKIMDSYKKFMAALLPIQSPEGLWRQILDDPKAWDETSCTGMFTFALARGVRHGWLEGDDYKRAAEKAWVALASPAFLTPDGKVKECCIGTNRGTDENYYLTRPRATGDLHGQAAVIWAAWAMLDLPEQH